VLLVQPRLKKIIQDYSGHGANRKQKLLWRIPALFALRQTPNSMKPGSCGGAICSPLSRCPEMRPHMISEFKNR
jgi:hypothetical protein